MGYRASGLGFAGGQAGVFACGVLAWWAAGHRLYATATLCLMLAVSLGAALLRSRRRPYGDGIAPVPVVAASFTLRSMALLDQTPSPLLLQVGDGRLLALNRAARALFATAGEVSWQDTRALLGDGGLLLALPRHLRWGDRHYAVHLCRLEEAGAVSHLATLTDISADVWAAEATALRDVLQILNHELMNALTPVASLSRSALDLLRDVTAPTAAIKALERVAVRAEGLIDFVESYRAISRLPAPQYAAVALPPFIDDIADLFRARWQGVTLAVSCQGGRDTFVCIDPDQIQLCLSNLLNNAAEAAQEQACPKVRLCVKVAEQSHTAVVRVEDNGPGIPPHQRDEVFRPFHTTKVQGTGVGLTLARQILHGHGVGLTLLADGEKGADALSGAVFSFELAIMP